MMRQGGLSLIELLIFIIVVSIGVVGILAVFNVTVRESADPVVRKQAIAVAEGVLDEILAKDYQNDVSDADNSSLILGCTPVTIPSCVPNTILDRKNYNDVDDYDLWNTTGVYQLDGTLSPVLGAYLVAVSVATTTLNAIPVKSVTVTVTGAGHTVELLGYRANYE